MRVWLTLGWIGALAISLGALSRAAESTPAGGTANSSLDPNTAYRAERSNPVTHQVDFSVIVTPPYGCKRLRVWLPLAPSDAAQEVGPSAFDTFPEDVEPEIDGEPTYGNRFAYFEFENPQGAQIIRHRFQATVWDLHWQLDPQRVTSVAQWPEPFAPYLAPTSINDTPAFQQVLNNIVPQRSTAGHDLLRVMSWIDRNLTYDHLQASLRADANHAFLTRRGHCSDYHGLCATMGRALGYPARVTYGLSLFPKNSPSHCKLEAYLPPYGWVSFDISETQKLAKSIESAEQLDQDQKAQLVAAAYERLRSGFRENSWLLMTKGTDYDLAPPAAQPVKVVRTAYIEADGIALPDPDPSNETKREFAWMTAHAYQADRPFDLPFRDWNTLASEAAE